MVWKQNFPAEPPSDYDPEHPYADPVARLEYREWQVRQKMVEMEKVKILRDKLRICYIKEGVNHYQNCRELALAYLESIKGIGFYRQNSGNYDKANTSYKA